MPTTFVLYGGKTSIDSPQNDEFFKTSIDLVHRENIHIVLCYWARPKEQWEALAKRDRPKITKQTSKRVTFSTAQDVEDLFIKLEQADVLYVAGGKAKLIEPFYPKLSQLKLKLKGKVYLGSSIGTFIVSTHYVLSHANQDENTVHHGLGILPISTLCHWNVEKKKQFKIDLLRQAAPEFPIILLDEQKFVKIIY